MIVYKHGTGCVVSIQTLKSRYFGSHSRLIISGPLHGRGVFSGH